MGPNQLKNKKGLIKHLLFACRSRMVMTKTLMRAPALRREQNAFPRQTTRMTDQSTTTGAESAEISSQRYEKKKDLEMSCLNS